MFYCAFFASTCHITYNVDLRGTNKHIYPYGILSSFLIHFDSCFSEINMSFGSYESNVNVKPAGKGTLKHTEKSIHTSLNLFLKFRF